MKLKDLCAFLAVAIAQARAQEGIDDALQSLMSAPPSGAPINRNGWTVECSSVEGDRPCDNTINGDPDSFWASEADGGPHQVTIDLGATHSVSGLVVRPGGSQPTDGWIERHEVLLSADGENWGPPVAYGVWYLDHSPKSAVFEPQPAQYVRLVALPYPENEGARSSIGDLDVYGAESYPAQSPNLGSWGQTIDFPIVPVAAGVNPFSGDVVFWSSNAPSTFDVQELPKVTYTSVWNPESGEVSQRVVSDTQHDMFCSGLSMDLTGRFIVSGGSTDQRTSIYDSAQNQWIPGGDMNIPRAYQSSAILNDGRVFTIGGSWRGGDNIHKDGEVYDPATNQWTSLPGALATPLITQDSNDFDANGERMGYFHSDNHAWLFGWKAGSVFQAGPSRQMNWYSVTGQGAVEGAGTRCDDANGVRCDAMCGNAVMYDAVEGKIITFGGAPDYSDSTAKADAFHISIGDPNTPPEVAPAGTSLNHARSFHTSALLPDGTVFLTGGQSFARVFEDSDPVLTSELYSPDTNSFVDQAPNSIPRTYHSWSILLPDARVLNGGGGLCGNCETNHFDAQIYTPAYLLREDGSPATRPVITSVLGDGAGYNGITTVPVGSNITVTADAAIKSASLIRYSTTTHTVNTDQRRIPLDVAQDGAEEHVFDIPDDSGIALPGYWMLFVLDDAGVPSEAATIQIL